MIYQYLFYLRENSRTAIITLCRVGSSMVEQRTLNPFVAGSNPARLICVGLPSCIFSIFSKNTSDNNPAVQHAFLFKEGFP